MLNEEKRKEQITEAYLKILSREPDVAGLNNYLFSDLSIESIEESLKTSKEYLTIQQANNFSGTVKSLGSGELLIMGSSPKTSANVESLRKAGIQAILNLCAPVPNPFDTSWCKYSLNVPLKSDEPISLEDLHKILDFMYENIVLAGRKTFIYSTDGMCRSPIVVALFLVAEKKLKFSDAIPILISKHKNINPSREMVSADVLEATKNYKFKGSIDRGTKDNVGAVLKDTQLDSVSVNISEYVEVTDRIYVGKDISPLVLEKLGALKIETVLDLNEKKVDLPPNKNSMSFVHLPMFPNSIDSLIPVALRAVKKYSLRGKIYIHGELPVVLMFVEGYMAANKSEFPDLKRISKVRGQLLTL